MPNDNQPHDPRTERELRETQDGISSERLPRTKLDVTDFNLVEFRLATGHDVEIKLRPSEFFDDSLQIQFYSVQVCSTEDTLPLKLVEQHVFRIDQENAPAVLPRLWHWLEDLGANPRLIAEFDSLDDFAEAVDELIATLAAEAVDDHLTQLPELTDPEAFDKVDDSIFNDQNDNTPER